MDNFSTYEGALTWINQQTKESACCKYGRNFQSIEDGIRDQTTRLATIRSFETKIKTLLDKTRDATKKTDLEKAFNNLKCVIDKKLHCLNTMSSVVSLEENCTRISRDMDEQAVALVNEAVGHQQDTPRNPGQHIAGFISSSAQDCVFGLRDNWEWIEELVTCVNTHLKNGSLYHQFFHEVAETEPWLVDDLQKISERYESRDLKGDEEDSKLLAAELDETYISLRQWEARTNLLWETASRLVPVNLRTTANTAPIPARMLCDYETKEISLRRNEHVLLLDNSKSQMWKIRNGKGEESEVPALTLLIPGPDQHAIDAAVNMRLRLLAEWTNALKRIGKRLICFMLLVFKPEYRTQEIEAIGSIKEMDKHQMLQILGFIEDGLKKHWSDHEGFVSLQERILALRMVLEQSSDGDNNDGKIQQSLMLQITTLGDIIKIYQDMFRDWELYKVAVEASRAPEMMLIVDKWEQLQFVTREFFLKFWKTQLPLDEREKKLLQPRDFVLDGVEYEDYVDSLSPKTPEFNTTTINSKITKDMMGTNTFTISQIKSDSGDFKVNQMSINGASEEGDKFSRFNGGGGERQETVPTTPKFTKTILHDRRISEDVFREESCEDNFSESYTPITVDCYSTPKADLSKVGSMSGTRIESKFQETVSSVTQSPAAMRQEMVDISPSPVQKTQLSTSSSITVDKAPVKAENKWQSSEGMFETVTKTETTRRETETNNRRDTETNRKETETNRNAMETNRKDTDTSRRETETNRKDTDTSRKETEKNEREKGSSGEGMNETRIRTEYRVASEKTVDQRSEVTGGAKGASRGPIRIGQTIDNTVHEEGFAELKEVNFHGIRKQAHEGTNFGMAIVRKTSETEQLCSAEMEEKKTFIIRAVINPEDEKEMSFEQAIMLGIICPNTGTYVNTVTGRTLPLATAMSDGLIKVVYTTTKRSPEKRSTIGIITIKTIREMSRPFDIISVRDTRMNAEVMRDEAIKRGIIDEQAGTYTDRRMGTKQVIADAARAGLVKIEYTDGAVNVAEPEIISKTYAVRAVVDRRAKKTVTFSEAMRTGIIDRESGAYRNNLTGEKMYVGDAIMRGFLKARLLKAEDAALGLNIDPENRMVIDKTEMIRKRLLRPLSVISAFKMAVKDSAMSGGRGKV